MKLDEYRVELNKINDDIAWDIIDETRIKNLNKNLAKLGYKLIPYNPFFKIERLDYMVPDQKGLRYA